MWKIQKPLTCKKFFALDFTLENPTILFFRALKVTQTNLAEINRSQKLKNKNVKKLQIKNIKQKKESNRGTNLTPWVLQDYNISFKWSK